MFHRMFCLEFHRGIHRIFHRTLTQINCSLRMFSRLFHRTFYSMFYDRVPSSNVPSTAPSNVPSNVLCRGCRELASGVWQQADAGWRCQAREQAAGSIECSIELSIERDRPIGRYVQSHFEMFREKRREQVCCSLPHVLHV